MNEKIKSELISRRTAFSLLGIAAALGLAVPATVLTVSDAEAQTSGMERRGAQVDTNGVKTDAKDVRNGVIRGAEAAQRPLALAPAPLGQSSL
jgi:hypothetical protein